MKKRLWFLFVFIILIISSFILVTITKKDVTGEITGLTDVSIFVLPNLPILTIINPENETYIYNISIPLNYTAVNADSVCYNLDNTANSTITGDLLFDTSEGLHTLFLYGNNTDGTTEANVTFTVNISKFRIYYNEYAGATKGLSNDFNYTTYEDLQNLSDLTLEHTEWGKITFNEIINVTQDADFSDRVADLDTNTNISENRIEINSVALPNFNKEATLRLYNLTFLDPRVLKDGSICPVSICTWISYTGGALKTLVFNVTGFTVYSAEEITEELPSSRGGGGSPGAQIKFLVNPTSFERTIIQNTTEYGEITITNQEGSPKFFRIQIGSIEDIISIEETTIEIPAGETKTIVFEIKSPEELGIYAGKIIVTSSGTRKEVFVVINVKTEKSLFDLMLLIPKSTIRVGENLSAQIDASQIGTKEITNVTLNYIIKDFNGEAPLLESETTTIYDQKSFIKNFNTEKFVAEDYVLGVELISPDGVAIASSRFKIREKIEINTILIILIIFVIFVFVVISLTIKKHKKIITHLHKQVKTEKRG